MHLFQLFSVITINSCILTIHGFNINATGGSFPSTLYRDATFAYQFLSSGDFVTYFGSSSTTGKCNIMGYWHNGDTLQSQSSIPIATKNRDTLICTDLCTVAVCGVSSAISPRFDRDSRSPLIDFAGSDSLLQASDYAAFPDLQMLPALAGATVPVYNIPDLSTSNISLTLSRQNIADIFKGKILYWNDSRILLSNPLVKGILSSIKLPIKVVVRTDSSGTSEIFTRALSLFDLKGISSPDYSFGATIRSGPTPSWCGLLTDEVQIITIGNCNSSLPTIDKVIHMKVLDKNRSLRNLRFMCDASAQNITTEFLKSSPGPGISVIVQKDIDRSGMINFQIGYSDASTIGIMWYKPSITYASPSLSVSIKTLQEGGYQNSHFSGVSFVTPQIQSIWVSSSGALFQFIVTITNSNKSYDITLNSETTAIGMRTAFNNIINGCVTSVEHIDPELLSTWIEYRITFSDTCSSTISELKVHPFLNQNTDSVYVMTMQDYNNYPQFYDDLNPRGYGRSGRYTCYLRQYSYRPWSYHTGDTNSGVIAEVITSPYSIGYSVLTDALSSSISMSNMINKANTVVTPSSVSVSYAIMDQGGNLGSNYDTAISDGPSSNAWPISGLSYYIIRTKHHIGSCSRRRAAMKYLYNFYYSTAVKEMARELGFATLPDIVRDIVVKKLIDVTQCNTGEYALAQYNAISSNIMSTHDFSSVLSSYLSVYRTVDSGARWDLMKSDDSRTILQHFSTEPEKFAGTLTMLNGKTQKLNYLNKEGLSTFAFAHLAVVFIYHLDYFTSCSNSQLRLNNYIIEGIFLGNITHWNDSKIQLANNNFKKCLPHLPITLVVRSNPSDTNSILIRYLTRISPEFSSIYDSQGGGTDFQYFNWSSILPKNRLKLVVGNSFSDNEVVAEDLTIGYYLHVTPPTSGVALYCPDETCTTVIHPNDDGHSIGICQNDINTIINPSSSLYSYDLMISKTVGCYPLVGTVDFSIYQAIPSSSCMMKNFSTILGLNKIRLGVFLFNGSTITKPLNILSSAPTSVEQRKSALSNICNLTCDGAAVGYKYCGYRDCSWSDGDYTQLVSACSPNTQRRKVTYVRTNTSCSENSMTVPPSAVLIECPYVLVHSHIAAGMITICVMGAIICGVILYLSYNYSHEKVLRRSQLIFVYIFLIGAIFMNFTLLCLLGENTKSSCMLRVWAVNLSSTLMFAPLIMKLHRVDVLYRTLQRGGRRRTISDFTVGMQVFGLVAVDVLILIIWTIVDTPREIVERKLYINTYHTIDDTVCSTNITEPFEKAMVSWKAILLVFGIIKAIQTWEVPKEISEAKHFAIAIYNIAVVGSFSYFLSVFGTVSVEVVVVLRCLGIFVCATVSAIVIMMPKLLAIQFSWTEMLLGSASSYKDEFSYSSTSHQPIPIAQTQLHNVHQNQNQNHNQNDGLPTLRINPALNLDLNAVLTQRNELPREDTALASGAIVHRDGVNL